MVPAYTDISHFRAPYKNSVISGYGGYRGYGQDDPPPPPPAPTAPPAAAYDETILVATDKDGYRSVKKSVRPMFMQALMKYGVSVIGGPNNNVKIFPFTAEQLDAAYGPNAVPATRAYIDSINAKTWNEKQEKAGNVVFSTVPLVHAVLYGQPIPEGSAILGTFPAGSAEAKEGAKAPYAVVLSGDPGGGGFSLASLGTMQMAVLIGGGLLVGAVVYKKMTKKGSGGRASSMAMPSRL